MRKKMRSVEVDLETSQIFQNGVEVQCPYDIYIAFKRMSTFEWLNENYSNNVEDLWKIAVEARELMEDAEGEYFLSEADAVDIACNNLNVTLMED